MPHSYTWPILSEWGIHLIETDAGKIANIGDFFKDADLL